MGNVIGMAMIVLGSMSMVSGGYYLGHLSAPKAIKEAVQKTVSDKYFAYKKTFSQEQFELDGETVYLVRRKPGYENAYEAFRASFGEEVYWKASYGPKTQIKLEGPSE